MNIVRQVDPTQVTLENPSNQFHELSVTAAAAAIKDGSFTSVEYATLLLRRCHEQAVLHAFITIDAKLLDLSSRMSAILGRIPSPQLT